jgi:hypothetical protein
MTGSPVGVEAINGLLKKHEILASSFDRLRMSVFSMA